MGLCVHCIDANKQCWYSSAVKSPVISMTLLKVVLFGIFSKSNCSCRHKCMLLSDTSKYTYQRFLFFRNSAFLIGTRTIFLQFTSENNHSLCKLFCGEVYSWTSHPELWISAFPQGLHHLFTILHAFLIGLLTVYGLSTLIIYLGEAKRRNSSRLFTMLEKQVKKWMPTKNKCFYWQIYCWG